MIQPAYTRDDLLAAIREVGICAGDVVSLHVSLGRLGLPRDVDRDFASISDVVVAAFLEVLGPSGTLLVPTYTYSFGRGEAFDIANTPAAIGEFAECFRTRCAIVRSRDPMLSTAGVGASAVEILGGISRSCYGSGSVFDKLFQHDAKICTLGLGLWWATYCHYIEKCANVPFRFDKLFAGIIREGERETRELWTYFAAPRINNCQSNSLAFEECVRDAGLLRRAMIGRGAITMVGAREFLECGLAALRRNSWFSAKGPACNQHELVTLEDQRVGAPTYEVALPMNASMRQMIDAVWTLPRDLVSNGFDAALQALASQIPLTIHDVPTGAQCWQWIIPEKWTCRDAYLETVDGRRILSYSDNPLHVASYSHSFSGVIERDVLLSHLHVHPVLEDAVPYHYLFNKAEWSLCCSRQTRAMLTEPQYRVLIDAEFSYGTLKVGEVVVPGERPECVVLCAHLDHPRQVNDGLSGCVVGIEIMRRLQQRRNLQCTYRLLLVAETIGSIAYLSTHESLIPLMQGGIFLEMAGLDYPLTLQHSIEPSSEFDRCCELVLRSYDSQLRVGKFLEVVTNDERQFNAPGVRIPMVSVSRVRTPVGRNGAWLYDEYHSERDDPMLTSDIRLEQTVEAVLAIIDRWDRNSIPEPLFRGEVFLSRHGIDYDYSIDPDYAQACFEIMHALDGRRSIIDLAWDSGRSIDTVRHIVDQFHAAGLVHYRNAHKDG